MVNPLSNLERPTIVYFEGTIRLAGGHKVAVTWGLLPKQGLVGPLP